MICGECALKHLRAALAHAEGHGRRGCPVAVSSPAALVSEAWVLLSETGSYPGHLDLAVGTLVRAEEEAFAGGQWKTVGTAVRRARIGCEGPEGLMAALEATGLVDPVAGHLLESAREGDVVLPGVVSAGWLVENFDRLAKTVRDAPAPEERKEGEEDMACAKKAAAKGGATKKAPVAKGGKVAKKGCKTKGCK